MASVKIDDRTVRDVWVKYKRTRRKVYKNKLIETYLPLVRNVAERMLMALPASVELDDLISMGTFGLIEAIEISMAPLMAVAFALTANRSPGQE